MSKTTFYKNNLYIAYILEVLTLHDGNQKSM